MENHAEYDDVLFYDHLEYPASERIFIVGFFCSNEYIFHDQHTICKDFFHHTHSVCEITEFQVHNTWTSNWFGRFLFHQLK